MNFFVSQIYLEISLRTNDVFQIFFSNFQTSFWRYIYRFWSFLGAYKKFHLLENNKLDLSNYYFLMISCYFLLYGFIGVIIRTKRWTKKIFRLQIIQPKPWNYSSKSEWNFFFLWFYDSFKFRMSGIIRLILPFSLIMKRKFWKTFSRFHNQSTSLILYYREND